MTRMNAHSQPDRVGDLFDRWAPSYDRSVLQSLLFAPTHVAVLDAAAAAGAHPNHVLDVGCGTAELLHRALAAWPDAHFVGVDAASNMIAAARRKHAGESRFRFDVGEAAELPLDAARVYGKCRAFCARTGSSCSVTSGQSGSWGPRCPAFTTPGPGRGSSKTQASA